MIKQDIIEYVMNTPHNTNRAVLSSMLNQLTEGGGEEPWTTLTEESVTTVSDGQGFYVGDVQFIFVDTPPEVLRIIFNGTEYECNRIAKGDAYVYGGFGELGPDFSTYPFFIFCTGDGTQLITETEGTYTIKIEIPQSSDSSDFSTAQVTVVNNTDSDVSTYGPVANIDDFGEMNISPQFTFSRGESLTILVMHKQHTYISLNTNATITVEGSAEIDGPDVIITGDCTITVGQAASTSE